MGEKSGIKKLFEDHWEKMVLWTILIGLLFLLRPLFLLIFETFVITYIMKSAIERTVQRFKLNYRLTTAIFFALFVSLLCVTGAWVGPKLIAESNQVLVDFAGEGEKQTQEKTNRFVEKIIQTVVGGKKAQTVMESERYIAVMNMLKGEAAKTFKVALPRVLDFLLRLVKLGWKLVVSLFIAIIFSFILVWDWRRTGAKMKMLEKSRIRTFYLETAPHIRAFADVLGKAFRAQVMIAICNTSLTVIGLSLFKMPNIALLSVIVFLCGFIPIFGTFISSVPILLFAVQVGGMTLVLKVIILIAVVHAVEAYFLNPRITGDVLHVHPLLVLVLIVAGERFFGLWGMILGVPVGYYIISVLTEKDEQFSSVSKDSEPDGS